MTSDGGVTISKTCPARCAIGGDIPDGWGQCPACGGGSLDPASADIQGKLGLLFANQVHRLADMLRHATDEVVRHGTYVPANPHDGKPDHQYAASEVVRDIQRLLGSAPLGALLSAAADADRLVRSEGTDRA